MGCFPWDCYRNDITMDNTANTVFGSYNISCRKGAPEICNECLILAHSFHAANRILHWCSLPWPAKQFYGYSHISKKNNLTVKAIVIWYIKKKHRSIFKGLLSTILGDLTHFWRHRGVHLIQKVFLKIYSSLGGGSGQEKSHRLKYRKRPSDSNLADGPKNGP